MKRLLIAGAMMALMIVPQSNVWADDDEFTPAQREQIRKMIQEKFQMQGGMTRLDPPSVDLSEEIPALGDTTKRKQRYGETFTGGGALEGGRTIYAKPFVKAPKATVGGYIDFIITDCTRSSKDCDQGLTFDQERFIPFIYSQVTDRISVASEIEFEHGATNAAGGSESKTGKVVLEFATMDYRVEDWLNFRGGIILVPLGRFNLTHDSPLNDLPLRPIASRFILPSTLQESGLGFYGSIYPTALSKVDYEFYVTQGFDGGRGFGSSEGTFCTGCISTGGLSGAKSSIQNDNNENKAIAGRIAVSPILGVEIAGSFHHGAWDSAGKNYLSIFATDWTFQRGPFELIGEAAWVGIEGGNAMDSSVTGIPAGVPPARMAGFYVQGNYHFMPEILNKLAPTHFGQSSTFTAIVRYGEADTNTQRSTNANDLTRLTLGLNFRPIEDSVIKFAYTFNGEPDDSPVGSDNDGWQFQAATYF